MLVLSRKCEQSLVLGDDIVITVLAIDGERVKLGIEAPRGVSVLRQELYNQIKLANAGAANSDHTSIRRVAAALRDQRRPLGPIQPA
jgi:carbon storage regulator